jgi:hypothetical protein
MSSGDRCIRACKKEVRIGIGMSEGLEHESKSVS